MRFSAEVTLGNLLVALTVITVGLGLAVTMTRFFYRLFEMFGWIMEMYFHYCQQAGKPVPEFLWQRYRTINGNAKETSTKAAGAGEFK